MDLMGLLKRLLRRERQQEQRPSSTGTQTHAEHDAADKYWKSEVAADKQRRGKPDKR